MRDIFDTIANETSRLTTKAYSTSFSMGIRFLAKEIREPIYAIYGFVRFADEIVDTFHEYDKRTLFERFKKDTYLALEEGISLNPILHSFQLAVRKYHIDRIHIDTFLRSMEMDLEKRDYTLVEYKDYIRGSAEVVGLMCLKVFCLGDQVKYDSLKDYANSLGSAYQKINFLRDLSADFNQLGRVYFPGIDMEEFNERTKRLILCDVELDFRLGFEGIKRLPANSRFGVYLSFVYFYALLQKIRFTPADRIMQQRIRVPNRKKFLLLFQSYIKYKLDLLS